jgi:CO dehydrogenase maturation factor
MKIAVAGKGGVGKTSLSAWMGDWLARQGRDVWLVDADTALSLGAALGLDPEETPTPLCQAEDLIRERTGGGGVINLNPRVDDLPGRLSLPVRGLRLMVMGAVAAAGGGCACAANALLKALLAHLFLSDGQWVVVDLEAGVEHLGRGTVDSAHGLVVVSDPSLRGLTVAASIGRMARDLGLTRQALVINRADGCAGDRLDLPALDGLPPLTAVLPALPSLTARQLKESSVLDLPERPDLDRACARILERLGGAQVQGDRHGP